MLFNSYNFILIFLVAFLLSYFLATYKLKKYVILFYSIAFYIIGSISSSYGIIILFISILLNYCFSLIIYKSKIYKKIFFSVFISLDVLSLVIFKLKVGGMLMPLGFSFVVFHYISYLSDLYTGKIEKIDALNYFNYILFFPKLISGPITRYSEFTTNYESDYVDKNDLIIGLFTFSSGLMLKCLLSDNLSYITNQIEVFGYESIGMITAWIGAYAYYFRLYFDFAGYSLMAIGIARMFGYSLPTNFDTPLASKSVSEFWRRWHITLGAFFRDYVYIPLGGNRSGKLRQAFNLFVVWLLTGFWHGLTPNYLIWAYVIYIFIVFEKFIYKIKNKYIGIVSVVIIMPLVFLIFEITKLPDLYIYFSRLIDIKSFGYSADLEVIMTNYFKIFIVSIIFATVLPKMIFNKIINNNKKVMMLILSFIFIALSLYMLSIGESDTFRYFTF